MEESLIDIVKHFAIKGDIIDVSPVGEGHINKTYRVKTTERKYILQRINTNVFNDVDELMNNIVRLTEHLIEKGVFTLRYKPTLDGRFYYSANGSRFRLYKFIDDTYCFNDVENLEIVEKAAQGFGEFHHNLADLDANDFYSVIPDFHTTPKRYDALLESVKKDPLDRVKNVQHMLKFFEEHKDVISKLTDALEDGSIPMGLAHNDPKINNVLFDRKTFGIKAVIDLDTVMPGTVLFDVGDALRSLFTGDKEDTKTPEIVGFDPDTYRAYLRGYHKEMKTVLNDKEVELLPYAPLVLAIELSIRFLKDYIDGDVYFATQRPNQNYDRAMSQYNLAKDMVERFDEIQQITNEIWTK